MRAVAFFTLAAVALVILPVSNEAKRLKKPFCEICENVVKTVDDVLQHGGDVEKAVDEFCKNDVPTFLVEICDKIVSKNLKYIIEKLKNHESPEKICTSIQLCRSEL